MRKKMELAILILVIAGLVLAGRNLGKYVSADAVKTKKNLVVLDAGHGGRDPGKVGVGNIEEKDINLAIAKKIQKLLEKRDVEVIMTREKDESLAPEGSSSRQVEDIKKRVALIDEAAPALAVSIHQNSYPQAEVRGAQVFYYQHSKEGEEAAAILQEALLAADPDNTRKEKANDTYYLLRRTKAPTIIVECGFLSNPEEAALLADEKYQDQIAEAVCAGIETCLGL